MARSAIWTASTARPPSLKTSDKQTVGIGVVAAKSNGGACMPLCVIKHGILLVEIGKIEMEAGDAGRKIDRPDEGGLRLAVTLELGKDESEIVER